ncbi:uncharacterized protein BXZ73DRAFT_75126 [Epithele typhae]|uniref:uncharacterized protein n=1 Tax=Epithele typhae TaxID=378194 RepID=UPI0020075938|nr:uncharacterized protein BXZ73DRAFT_75126 [Epithele typhae]KAH9941158.1 hypothetical protein BXZ73DRAFT_75126 [Epithele typhae]
MSSAAAALTLKQNDNFEDPQRPSLGLSGADKRDSDAYVVLIAGQYGADLYPMPISILISAPVQLVPSPPVNVNVNMYQVNNFVVNHYLGPPEHSGSEFIAQGSRRGRTPTVSCPSHPPSDLAYQQGNTSYCPNHPNMCRGCPFHPPGTAQFSRLGETPPRPPVALPPAHPGQGQMWTPPSIRDQDWSLRSWEQRPDEDPCRPVIPEYHYTSVFPSYAAPSFRRARSRGRA